MFKKKKGYKRKKNKKNKGDLQISNLEKSRILSL